MALLPENRELFKWFRMSYPFSCFYCGIELGFRFGLGRTLDHVIPKAAGGSDSRRNKVPACEPCNAAKANLLLEEFRTVRFSGKDIEFFGEQAFRTRLNPSPDCTPNGPPR